MSKAIAIIDMPPSCIGCPFSDPYWDCCLTSESVGDYDAERPDFCPLRPMPQKQKFYPRHMNTDTNDEHFIFGWNRCIEAIERRQQ